MTRMNIKKTIAVLAGFFLWVSPAISCEIIQNSILAQMILLREHLNKNSKDIKSIINRLEEMDKKSKVSEKKVKEE